MSLPRRACVLPEEGTADVRGFTLIELVVVMALMGIMLFVAIPSFQHFLTDDTRKASQWILVQVPRLKARAVSDTALYILHVDLDENVMWVSNGAMPEEFTEQERKQERPFSEDSVLLDVAYPDGETIDSGQADICFYPKGYSDKAIIHMEDDDGARRSFLIEPFLNQVEMKEAYVEFEG